MDEHPESHDSSSAATATATRDDPPGGGDVHRRWIVAAVVVGCGLALLCGNGSATVLVFWAVAALRAIFPGPGGIVGAAIALAIGVLVLVSGPSGQLGIVDFHTFMRHPYAQPGKFFVWVGGGLLLLRVWTGLGPALARRGVLGTRAQIVAGLIVALAAGAWVVKSRGESVDTVVARLSQDGRVTPDGLERLMRAVARRYEDWGHAEGDMSWAYRFGPPLCRGPGGPTARISASQDQATHGRKLYTVYAKERRSYLALYWANRRAARDDAGKRRGTDGDAAAGQVVVKESFVPVPVKTTNNRAYGWGMTAAMDGVLYHPGARGDLFVMVHLDPRVEGTDDGWVYGTVTPDGRRVTSAGLVGNCMGCHADAPHGRLFGLPADD